MMSPPDRPRDRSLLGRPPVGLCACRGLTIEYCNGTFVDLFGYSDTEGPRGRSLPELIGPSDRDRVDAQLRELVSTDRETVSTTATGLTRAGDSVPIGLFAGSVRVGDSTIVVASVSERPSRPPAGETRRADGLRQTDPTAALVAELAHDLRNPLTVATGHLELLRQQLSDQSEEHTQRLERALSRMETLIDDALTAAGTEPSIDRRLVEFGDIAERAWQTVPTDGASLTVEGSRTVSADPKELSRLFENLFRNAVEHGGSRVRIEVGELGAAPGFYVADDGPGIPPADRDRAFEPGYTTCQAGTGLGLAIVSKIVAAHGWQVDLTESAAGGTRVEIHTDGDPRSASAS